MACFAPQPLEHAVDAELHIERHGLTTERVKAGVRFLAANTACGTNVTKPPPTALVLLTNGRGGMARLCVDLGGINSKYDCALGANLHAEFPVDRHVFVKRIRVWICADGFITALNLQNLTSIQFGQPAVWNFVADAGDGRTVEIQLTAAMLENWNTTTFTFARMPGTKPADLPPQFDVRLTVRADIEDRNFHSETHRNDGAEYHFNQNCRELPDRPGFAFTPAADRQLRVFSSAGVYHAEPEWCQGIPHPVEQSRGQVSAGDAYSPGWFDLPLAPAKNVSVVLSADIPPPVFELVEEVFRQPSAPLDKLALNAANFPADDAFGRQLALAARAFVARRGAGCTVIAGYPWFLDWGRDSFICARGMLAAGMVPEVSELLTTFGRFAENGLMPNTIHGEDASNRDTSDAPLWYGIVCEEAAAQRIKIYMTDPVGKGGRNHRAMCCGKSPPVTRAGRRMASAWTRPPG